MKILKRLLLGVALLAIVLVAAAYLLPREVSVERSIVIEASAEKIFPMVNDLKMAAEWSPWTKIDPEMQFEYSGPEMGVGQTYKWKSEDSRVGSGTQIIAVSTENELVESSLDFGDMGVATIRLILAADGDKTNVTWWFNTDMGPNPIGRYMGLMMDGLVGGDFETGLANLKTMAESGS